MMSIKFYYSFRHRETGKGTVHSFSNDFNENLANNCDVLQFEYETEILSLAKNIESVVLTEDVSIETDRCMKENKIPLKGFHGKKHMLNASHLKGTT